MNNVNQIISPKAKIGANVNIGFYTIIEAGVVIEDDVQIFPYTNCSFHRLFDER